LRLDKRVAIVTGGGQEIGQQISLRLAQEGAHVVIADINEKGSRETAEMIGRNGEPKATVIPTDITYEDQVIKLVKGALQIDNRIDILVNNAGIAGPSGNIEDIALEDWEATMAVNLRGMFLCCKHAVPAMKKQKNGCIINISSTSAKRGLPQRTPYTTSKMGVIGLTRTLAMEVGKWKIRVSAICPGAVEGARHRLIEEMIMRHTGKSREQVIAEFTDLTALKTFIDPKYVAAVVAFLCSDDAAMMTGQDINVNAGTTMF
jgi:NAD(P)-dependent dehydrogenase (short-subunit alcohol dehydrogenase family)